MPTDVVLPRISKNYGEAVTVKRWFYQNGEVVEQNRPLVAIETDKVIVEISAPVAGVLLQIYAEEGQLVQPGELLAVIS